MESLFCVTVSHENLVEMYVLWSEYKASAIYVRFLWNYMIYTDTKLFACYYMFPFIHNSNTLHVYVKKWSHNLKTAETTRFTLSAPGADLGDNRQKRWTSVTRMLHLQHIS